MTDKQSSEHPVHSDEYKQAHPHIHVVKYKGKNGKQKVYTYRYGEIKSRKRKTHLDRARND